MYIGLEHTAMIRNALISMYSKCASIKEASQIFYETGSDDIISWTAMINGYAEHGYIREAIGLFEKLPRVGLRPDSVIFIEVLTACIDLGFHYFSLMNSEYRINPSKEHYGCMIDLLCMAGRLSDAETMIKSMPHQQDDVFWSTLLQACRVHGNADCGRSTAQNILELDPNCAGTHITLDNIYGAKGRWREAAEVRKMMRSKEVIEEQGWSWIKVRGQVSAFVSDDRGHVEDIFHVLELLDSGAEVAILEVNSLTHDVED